MTRQVTYGPGGYDPRKPGHNIVEDIEVPDPVVDPSPGELVAAEVVALREALVKRGAVTREEIDAQRPTRPPPPPTARK
jgi:hypothetical protein